jgi:hypothetical protein
MNMKGWIMGVSWGLLCSTSWGFVDGWVGSGSKERSKPKESFKLKKQEDGVARLIQAVKNCSEKAEDHSPAVRIAVEILQDHLDKPDLDPMLQTLIRKFRGKSYLKIRKFKRHYPEMVINVLKGCLDFMGQTRDLQTLEEHLVNDNLTLPFSALSEEDRNFVRECTPEGRESETYYFLLDELSKYLLGKQPEADTPEPDISSEEDDDASEEEESLDDFQREDYDLSLRENDPVWLKQIKKPITQQLASNHTPEELHQRSIDFKKSLQNKNDLPWGERFNLSIVQQLNLCHTPEALRRMNIDHEKLIKIELALGLRQRELTPKEKLQLFKAIYALDRSLEQCLLDAIFNASYTPKTSFQKVKSTIEEGGVDVNSKYKEFSFLVMAAGVCKNRGLEIVQFLLDHGADIEIADGLGWPALHNAVSEKNIEIVKLLIERGANVNAQARSLGKEYWTEGWTPLHFALNYGYFQIAKVLLANGADPNIRDDEGRTPFDLAVEKREKIENETKRRKFDEALNELRLPTP